MVVVWSSFYLLLFIMLFLEGSCLAILSAIESHGSMSSGISFAECKRAR